MTGKNESASGGSISFCTSHLGVFSVGCFCFLFTDFSNINISPGAMAIGSLLGIVASGLGFFLWNKGLLGEPGNIGCFYQCSRTFAVLCSLFAFGEIELEHEDLLRLVLGGSLILGAVAMSKPLAQSLE